MAIPNQQKRRLQEQIQVWQKVRKHFNKYFESSLCAFFVKLKAKEIIDFSEYLYITGQLKDWGIKNGKDPDLFFWPKGEEKERRKFIDGKVKRLTAELDLLCKS